MGAIFFANSRKLILDTIPISMFCGFPMIVAALPMFAEVARAIRSGTGFIFEANAILTTIGVMKTQIVSFTNSAERKAEVVIIKRSILTSVFEKERIFIAR
jgi:hypothetical protein